MHRVFARKFLCRQHATLHLTTWRNQRALPMIGARPRRERSSSSRGRDDDEDLSNWQERDADRSRFDRRATSRTWESDETRSSREEIKDPWNTKWSSEERTANEKSDNKWEKRHPKMRDERRQSSQDSRESFNWKISFGNGTRTRQRHARPSSSDRGGGSASSEPNALRSAVQNVLEYAVQACSRMLARAFAQSYTQRVNEISAECFSMQKKLFMIGASLREYLFSTQEQIPILTEGAVLKDKHSIAPQIERVFTSLQYDQSAETDVAQMVRDHIRKEFNWHSVVEMRDGRQMERIVLELPVVVRIPDSNSSDGGGGGGGDGQVLQHRVELTALYDPDADIIVEVSNVHVHLLIDTKLREQK